MIEERITIQMGKTSDISCSFPVNSRSYMENLNVETKAQESENGYVLHLSGSMEQNASGFSQQTSIDPKEGVTLNLSLPDTQEILTIYQHKSWWTRPSFPESIDQIPDRSQLVLLKYDSLYICLLAICSKDYRADFEGSQDEDGNPIIRLRTSSNKEGMRDIDAPAAVISYEEDPYACIARAGELGAKAAGHPEMLRKNKIFPEIFEHFGWCTWNAFYHDVSEKKIEDKLGEFQKQEIPVQWVLIDDGWQDTDPDKKELLGLDANPNTFPDGLSGTVSMIREKYHIPHVGVWHPVMGYWNGIQKESSADKILSPYTETLPDGRIVPSCDASRAFGFYHSLHSYLRSQCGIDFVKADEESSVSTFQAGRKSYGQASQGIQDGLCASTGLSFHGNVIHCMGMAPEELWHRTAGAVARTSDDFDPDADQGFLEHALQNAYSSLWSGLFTWSDFDMFVSDHKEARQHAILRAISGGPVYVTDPIGSTDKEEIMPLLYEDGRVIRCENIGLPTMDCLFHDPVEEGAILKIFNQKGKRYYIAAFNMSEEGESAVTLLSIQDIPGLAGKNWIVYDRDRAVCQLLSEQEPLRISLDAGDACMLELAPAENLCVLGNPAKYISSSCVEILQERREVVAIRVLEDGIVSVFSDQDIQAMNLTGDDKQVLGGNNLYEIQGCRKGEIISIYPKGGWG